MLDFTSNVVPSEWRIPKKGTDDLFKYDGETGKFKDWRVRMANHIASEHPGWFRLLNLSRTSKKPTAPQWLTTITVTDNLNAGDLARDLYLFIGKFIGKPISPHAYHGIL